MLSFENKNGLNSFSLFLMIIDYLEKRNFKQKEKMEDYCWKIGLVFLDMFYYYSYQFDFYNEVVITKSILGFVCDEKMRLDPFLEYRNKKFKLKILNPLKDDIVITNSFHKTDELKFFFKKLYSNFYRKYGTSLNIDFEKEMEKFVSKTQKNVNFNKKNNNKGQTMISNEIIITNKVEDKENFCCKQKINSLNK